MTTAPGTEQRRSSAGDGDRPACRVVYIAGTGRSGSTLVAQCLERATDSVHVGELRYVWERGLGENHLCECGQPFAQCPFWSEVLATAYGADAASVGARVRALGARVDRIRHIPQALTGAGAQFRRARAEYDRLLTPLYRAVEQVSGAAVVIDSSKDPSYLYALGGLAELDVVPVHLVRDPRAVAYSWTRKRRRPEIHWEERYMRTLRPRRSAAIWLEYNAAIDVFTSRAALGERVRYEDFAAAPDDVTARLVAALALPARRGEPGPGHSLSGNPMRFERGPLVVRPDTEWERGLPAADRRVVTAITAPLLHRYGYRVRGPHPAT